MRLRILLSYYFYSDTEMDDLLAKHFTEPYPEVFADSGAFSAWNLGGKLDVGAYADWLHRNKHRLTAYANLDVKGDVKAGLKNLAYLEGRGLSPLPVFHGGDPWSVLQEMVRTYPYIALGGLAGAGVGMANREVGAFMVRCFQIAAKRSVFHAFGMTTWRYLKDFPWYSADSTSWGSGYRFGAIGVFDPQRGAFVMLRYNTPDWRKHAGLVRSYGYDPADFMARTPPREKVGGLSALSYLKAEQYLRRIHGEIRIPGAPPPPTSDDAGPKVILAHGSTGHLSFADAGMKTYLASAGGDMNRLGAATREAGAKLYLGVGANRGVASHMAQIAREVAE